MALNSLGLNFVFGATDFASATMGRLERNFTGLQEQAGRKVDGISEKLQMLGAGLVITGAGVAGLKGAFAAASAFDDFELAVAQTGAVSRASAEEVDLLRQAAIKAGIETQFSPTEAIHGLTALAQSGYDARTSIDLLQPSLDLAAGSLGQLSVEDATGLVAQSMKAFGIETKFAKNAVDQMLLSVNNFAVAPRDLALGIGIASRGAQTLNQSLTETTIAFGLVKNVIPTVERGATGLAVSMERLANPKIQKKLREGLGVDVVDEATGNFKPFLDIIQEMIPALNKMSLQQRAAFVEETFGAHSLASLNALFTQLSTGIKTQGGVTLKGAEAIAYYRKQFAGASGVAEEFRKKLLDTAAGQKLLLKGSLETLAVVGGETFSQILRPAIEVTIKVANKLIAWLQHASPALKKVAVGGFVLASALAVIGGGMITLGAIGPLFVTGLSLASGAMSSLAGATLSTAAAMLPWLLLAASVGFLMWELTHKGSWLSITLAGVATAFSGLLIARRVAVGVDVLTTAATRLWVALAANPIVLIIGLLLLLGLTIAAISNNWFGMRDNFVAGIAVMKDALKPLLQALDVVLKVAEILFNPQAFAESVKTAGLAAALQESTIQKLTGKSVDEILGAGNAATSARSIHAQQAAGGGIEKATPLAAGGPVSTGFLGTIEQAQSQAGDAGGFAEIAKQLHIDPQELAKAIGGEVAKRPVVLNIDGEQVAAAGARARRSDAVRSGHAAGVE